MKFRCKLFFYSGKTFIYVLHIICIIFTDFSNFFILLLSDIDLLDYILTTDTHDVFLIIHIFREVLDFGFAVYRLFAKNWK